MNDLLAKIFERLAKLLSSSIPEFCRHKTQYDMTTAELPEQLRLSHAGLWHECGSINPLLQHARANGKWSALQHLQHVHKGIAAICDYLKLDKKTIQTTFGVASHESRTYDGVLNFYTSRLREGAVSTPRFNPAASDISFHDELEAGKRAVTETIDAIKHWTDAELDHYACPHPNLGMLTAREMLFFAVIHAVHHTRAIHSIRRSIENGTLVLS
jgi:hypothetical protein